MPLLIFVVGLPIYNTDRHSDKYAVILVSLRRIVTRNTNGNTLLYPTKGIRPTSFPSLPEVRPLVVISYIILRDLIIQSTIFIDNFSKPPLMDLIIQSTIFIDNFAKPPLMLGRKRVLISNLSSLDIITYPCPKLNASFVYFCRQKVKSGPICSLKYVKDFIALRASEFM